MRLALPNISRFPTTAHDMQASALDFIIEPKSEIVAQTTDYYPYGLPMPTYTGAFQNRYKYGAKEFETRNGLNFHDFEARMLFNDHTLFARPDDKAIDYPATNPYLYCAANPLRYVDPTGEDYYTVDIDGNFTLTEVTDDDFDRIISTLGNCPAIDVDKSFMQSMITESRPLRFSDGTIMEKVTVNVYSGISVSNELHEFLAKNTDAEWTISEMNTQDGQSTYYLGTTHQSGSDGRPTLMLEIAQDNNYEIISMSHNHYVGNRTISGGDTKTAGIIQATFPNAKFSIIFPGSNETPKYYDKDTPSGVLPEVIIEYKLKK